MRVAWIILMLGLVAGCSAPPARELQEAKQDYASGDYERAASKARRALTRVEDVSQKQAAQELLADTYLKQNDYSNALTQYEELLRQEPDSRKYRSGVQQVRSALREAALREADAKLVQAESGFHAGDVGGATRLAQEALNVYQTNAAPPSKIASSQALIGQCYVDRQQFQEAEDQLRQALQNEPTNGAYQSALRNLQKIKQRRLHLEIEGHSYDIPVMRFGFSRRSVEVVASPTAGKLPYLGLRGTLPRDATGPASLENTTVALKGEPVAFGGASQKSEPTSVEGSLTLREIAPHGEAGFWDVQAEIVLKWSDGKVFREARGTLQGVADAPAESSPGDSPPRG
ncbi:MAG: tetratricopeptide repeat protein [Armatimonadetes bacterium]|nr:tetratricopeptide repeat protein [Armatimonadota bacterium]